MAAEPRPGWSARVNPGPVRIAIIGLGGYARAHHLAVRDLERTGEARLVATCDPCPRQGEAARAELDLAGRGVPVFTHHRELLGFPDLDLVVVPTPIALHAEMHRDAVRAGVPVYLEKPPTLDPREFARMLAVERTARRATWVGFNFAAEPTRLALKRRLLAGEFGPLHEVRVEAAWPRHPSYFTRNPWAGRLRDAGGALVLDSCLGNALAHYVHNGLQWAGGPGVAHWARPRAVQAAFFRAHRIETTDTVLVASRLEGGARLRLAFTHACAGESAHAETLRCARATIRYVTGAGVTIRWRDGHVESPPLEPFDPLRDNHRACYAWLRGDRPRPATTLEDASAFLELHTLAFISAREVDLLPAAAIGTDPGGLLQVAGLEPAMRAFLDNERWPLAWMPRGVPASAEPGADLPERLDATIDRLRAAAGAGAGSPPPG